MNMALTESTMLPLGSKAQPFSLPDPSGKTYELSQFKDSKALLIIFMCNHCPYVKHIADSLASLARDYQDAPFSLVAINSNDFSNYPDDSPAKMAEEVANPGYTFPYLVDESQEVAKAYRAVCTPDLFLYDADQTLAYRGQYDSSRPGKGAATGEDIRRAIDALLAGNSVDEKQTPAIGCNIKWRA